MPGSKPGERRGGRQKGTPNKATADIKAALRMHGDELVKALLKLTKSEDERVRLSAINAWRSTCLGGRPTGRISRWAMLFCKIGLIGRRIA